MFGPVITMNVPFSVHWVREGISMGWILPSDISTSLLTKELTKASTQGCLAAFNRIVLLPGKDE